MHIGDLSQKAGTVTQARQLYCSPLVNGTSMLLTKSTVMPTTEHEQRCDMLRLTVGLSFFIFNSKNMKNSDLIKKIFFHFPIKYIRFFYTFNLFFHYFYPKVHTFIYKSPHFNTKNHNTPNNSLNLNF